MLVPLHGFVQGDTVGLLVLVHDTDTIAQLARVLVEAAAVRVLPAPGARVYRSGRELDPSLTVAGAGLSALERIDLVPQWSPPAEGSAAGRAEAGR